MFVVFLLLFSWFEPVFADDYFLEWNASKGFSFDKPEEIILKNFSTNVDLEADGLKFNDISIDSGTYSASALNTKIDGMSSFSSTFNSYNNIEVTLSNNSKFDKFFLSADAASKFLAAGSNEITYKYEGDTETTDSISNEEINKDYNTTASDLSSFFDAFSGDTINSYFHFYYNSVPDHELVIEDGSKNVEVELSFSNTFNKDIKNINSLKITNVPLSSKISNLSVMDVYSSDNSYSSFKNGFNIEGDSEQTGSASVSLGEQVTSEGISSSSTINVFGDLRIETEQQINSLFNVYDDLIIDAAANLTKIKILEGGTLEIYSDALLTAGTIINQGGTFKPSGGFISNYIQNDGNFDSDGSGVSFDASITFNNGTATQSSINGARSLAINCDLTLNNLTNTSKVDLAADKTLTINGTLKELGTLNNNGTIKFVSGIDSSSSSNYVNINSGTVEVDGTMKNYTDLSCEEINVNANATLELYYYQNSTTINNNGTVKIPDYSKHELNGTILGGIISFGKYANVKVASNINSNIILNKDNDLNLLFPVNGISTSKVESANIGNINDPSTKIIFELSNTSEFKVGSTETLDLFTSNISNTSISDNDSALLNFAHTGTGDISVTRTALSQLNLSKAEPNIIALIDQSINSGIASKQVNSFIDTLSSLETSDKVDQALLELSPAIDHSINISEHKITELGLDLIHSRLRTHRLHSYYNSGEQWSNNIWLMGLTQHGKGELRYAGKFKNMTNGYGLGYDWELSNDSFIGLGLVQIRHKLQLTKNDKNTVTDALQLELYYDYEEKDIQTSWFFNTITSVSQREHTVYEYGKSLPRTSSYYESFLCGESLKFGFTSEIYDSIRAGLYIKSSYNYFYQPKTTQQNSIFEFAQRQDHIVNLGAGIILLLPNISENSYVDPSIELGYSRTFNLASNKPKFSLIGQSNNLEMLQEDLAANAFNITLGLDLMLDGQHDLKFKAFMETRKKYQQFGVMLNYKRNF